MNSLNSWKQPVFAPCGNPWESYNDVKEHGQLTLVT